MARAKRRVAFLKISSRQSTLPWKSTIPKIRSLQTGLKRLLFLILPQPRLILPVIMSACWLIFVQPDDWDEEASYEILDEDAEKPEGWLDDEPTTIPDAGMLPLDLNQLKSHSLFKTP
jgi:hypothetical protein